MTVGLNIMQIGDKKNLPEILKEEAVYSGRMTEDKLWLGLNKVRDEKSKEMKYETLVIFIEGLVKTYPGVMYYENKIENFPDDYAKNFYKCWEKKSAALIKKIPKKDQAKAFEELNKVKTPFVQYPGYYFWNSGIDSLCVIYLIILFMVTFFASSTYSDSMEDGSMEIIYTTKLRKKIMFVRFLPVIIYGLLLTFIATLSTLSTLGSVTGLKTLNSSLKTFALFSIGNFTLGRGILLMFVSELLGVLALTTVMGLISYKTENTNLSISIGVAINVLYIIIASFVNVQCKFCQIILNALPLASSQVINGVTGFHFDMSIWRPYAIMINMVIVAIVFSIVFFTLIKKRF